jgi:hypothetical protein
VTVIALIIAGEGEDVDVRAAEVGQMIAATARKLGEPRIKEGRSFEAPSQSA